MNDVIVDRREVLLAIFVAALQPAHVIAATGTEYPAGLSALRNALPASLADDDFACDIGRSFLAANPDEANLEFLISATIDDPVLQDRKRGAIGENRDIAVAVRQNFLQRHENDCAAMNMVNVDGCILSRTEARFYALAATLSSG